MHLKDIHLSSFRNHRSLHLALIPGINLITGANGVGKTNLLDAIYMLGQGKSYLLATDQQLMQENSDYYRVSGTFGKGDHREIQVAVACKKGGRKQISLNGNKKISRSGLLGQFPVVMITPADISLLLEGSEDRRHFMDESISMTNKDFLQNLMRYNRLLEQRNAWLRQMAVSGNKDEATLLVFDEQMDAPARVLYHGREQFFSELNPFFEQTYRAIAGSNEKASLSYLSDLKLRSFTALMLENRNKDYVLERTTRGMHRDDLEFQVNSFPVKKFASQGQTKTVLIALKLAQYHYIAQKTGMKPILLLDDICEKIDSKRLQELVRSISGPEFGQILISDTDPVRLISAFGSHPAEKKMFNIEAL